jgi:capsular exopolysaccharide synthesis family protein
LTSTVGSQEDFTEARESGVPLDSAEGSAVLDAGSNGGHWLQASPHRDGLARATEASSEPVFSDSDELFRSIYTRAGTGFTSEVLAVCSAVSGEGKSTVAVGLGVTIAQDFPDRRVLLVETDVQRPVLAADFETDATPGLMECLVDRAPLQLACRPTCIPNLHIVPVGDMTNLTGRPLRSSHMAAIVDAMRQMYDVIIIDLPALLTNSDAALLTDLADGVICVVRAGVTPSSMVNRALDQIDETKLRGLVLNGSTSSIPGWLRRLSGL